MRKLIGRRRDPARTPVVPYWRRWCNCAAGLIRALCPDICIDAIEVGRAAWVVSRAAKKVRRRQRRR